MDIIADMFVVTPDWLHRHGKSGVGWTRAQVETLGVSWPLEKGWLMGMAGRLITQEQRRAFEARGIVPGQSKRPRPTKPQPLPSRRPARFSPPSPGRFYPSCSACFGAGRREGVPCQRCHGSGVAARPA